MSKGRFTFRHLRTKLLAAFLAVMFIPLVEIGLYGYFFTSRVLSERAISRSAQEVQLQAEHIVRALEQAQGDALYLAQLRSLKMMRSLRNQGASPAQIDLWRAEAAQDLMVLLSVRPMYQNLRYIDSQGMERVRVESDGQRVRNMSVTELADRRTFAYFQRAMGQSSESVFVSSFSLDQDMQADVPVVHYAMKLVDQEGIVLIDIHAGWILRNLPPSGGPDTWSLIDQEGHYLVYPENYVSRSMTGSDSVGISLGMEALLSGRTGTFESQTSVYVYNTIFPAAGAKARFWVLYRETPRSVFYADGDDFYHKAALFVGAALALTVGMALVISHSIVNPIEDLKRQVADFGRGGPAPTRPDRVAMDEIGSLTRAFGEMARELEGKRQESKLLIERLINAQEEERKLVAYDLHDGLIQQMVGARFYLNHCRQHCPIDAQDAQHDFKRGCEALSEAIVEGRRIIEGLRPAALDDLGFHDALVELAQTAAATSGWELTLDLHRLPFEPDKSVSVTLYRIAQEALNNIRKHANARLVEVQMMNGEGISLLIRDDGKGFEVEQTLKDAHGLGITTMYERAALLKGECRIVAAPGLGTSVRVWIPWRPAEKFVSVSEVDGVRG